jgi:hypothetical protein
VVGLFVSTVVAAPNDRAGVDAELAKSAARITKCGRAFKATYDWRAYDAIDWQTVGKDPVDWVAYERPTVREIGDAMNDACADADVRAMLAGVDTIVYRPTSNEHPRLAAAIAGNTITFTNYTFGSTRGRDDYREALMQSSVPEVKSSVATAKSAPVAKPKVTASSAWDGKYAFRTSDGDAAGCFRADVVRPLTIAKGTFSFAWVPGDWPTSVTQLGHVDGAVNAAGAGSATVTFTDATRTSKQVTMVKAWRALESVRTMTIKIRKTESGREVTASVDGKSCSGTWEWSDPKPKAVAKHSPAPAKSREPTKQREDTKQRDEDKRIADKQREDTKQRDEEQRRRQEKQFEDDKRRSEEERRDLQKRIDDTARRAEEADKKERCVDRCHSKQTTCHFSCEKTRDSCEDRCDFSDNSCRNACEDTKNSCQAECRRDSCDEQCD